MDEKILEILSRTFNLKKEDIDPSLTQKEIENWDSLTHMDLITTIEKEYNISLTMEDILEMNSIMGIQNVIHKFNTTV